MQFRHLQHYILAILFVCGLILSLVFGAIAYQMIQSQALEDSRQLVRNLITTVNGSASAAVFSGDNMVGKDAINGLLANEAVYSVELEGFADELNQGMKLSGINKQAVSGLEAIVVDLKSPFDEQVLGKLTVQPSADWVKRIAFESASNMILSLIVVIFSSCLVTAQLIKWFISKPLFDVVEQLQQIKPGSETRLKLPQHLTKNEIGALVNEFNNMLDRIKQAILVERGLRRDMEVVQSNLEQAKVVAEQATLAKSNFLATMSHEIRTPMNSILGFIELALESPELGIETRRHLEIANTSARFLLQLINDILDVSKIESGKLELDIHSFDLRALLDEISDLMAIKAREKSLALHLNYPADMWPSYQGDPYRLRQIFINLVGNAIKFTEKGEVELDVKLLSVKGEQALFEFSIVDTGIGIAEDKIEQILQPFTQVDASISRQFGGTGLGTTISSELVQLMGGELKIQSILAKGSRFYFAIELSRGDLTGIVIDNEKTDYSEVEQALAPMKILLVDDVLENITLAKIRLEKAGHHIETAADGVEAVAMAKTMAFDLILMDIQMPNMDGYQATAAIRQLTEHDGYNQTVPIVALTANAMKDVQQQVLDAGMDEFVVKPIDFDKLFNTIAKVSPQHVITVAKSTVATTETEDINKPVETTELVNVEGAITAWLDKDTYFNAIKGFYQRNQETNSGLKCLVNVQDKAGLDSAIHKIKGAAGNLQLNLLYQHSCELEELLAQSSQNSLSQNLITTLSQTMDETLKEIAQLLQLDQNQTVDDSCKDKADVDKPHLSAAELVRFRACIDEIVQGCEQHDPDMAETGLEQLGALVDKAYLTDIDARLQQFDFDSTLTLVNALREEIQ